MGHTCHMTNFVDLRNLSPTSVKRLGSNNYARESGKLLLGLLTCFMLSSHLVSLLNGVLLPYICQGREYYA